MEITFDVDEDKEGAVISEVISVGRGKEVIADQREDCIGVVNFFIKDKAMYIPTGFKGLGIEKEVEISGRMVNSSVKGVSIEEEVIIDETE